MPKPNSFMDMEWWELGSAETFVPGINIINPVVTITIRKSYFIIVNNLTLI